VRVIVLTVEVNMARGTYRRRAPAFAVEDVVVRVPRPVWFPSAPPFADPQWLPCGQRLIRRLNAAHPCVTLRPAPARAQNSECGKVHHHHRCEAFTQ
jgi:hypothetical protein